MKKISAKIIADSINPQGNRITSFLLTYPRMIHCFDEKTRILSQISNEHPEFRSFEAVNSLKCKVAQYDKGVISFVYPENFIKNKGTHKMINFDKKKFSLSVTDKHRIHTLKRTTNNEFVENVILAEELLTQYGNRRIIQSGYMNQNQYFSNSELELIAWFVADGHLENDKVIFHFRKARKANKVISILKNLNIEFNYSEYDNVLFTKDYVIKFDAPSWCGKCYEDNIKKLPDEACFMTQKGYLNFKQALLESDGNVDNCEYNTTSNILANQLQVIALLHNEVINIRKYNRLYKQKFQKTNYISIRHDKDKFAISQEEGTVYCVTVPSSFLVVERSGIAFISGNCELMTHRM